MEEWELCKPDRKQQKRNYRETQPLIWQMLFYNSPFTVSKMVL